MKITRHIFLISIIAALCVVSVSCDKETKKKASDNPYIKSIKIAKDLKDKAGLNTLRSALVRYTAENHGKFPKTISGEFRQKYLSGADIAKIIYTGTGLTTTDRDRGVVAYLPPPSGTYMYQVLLADFTVKPLDKKTLHYMLNAQKQLPE